MSANRSGIKREQSDTSGNYGEVSGIIGKESDFSQYSARAHEAHILFDP